MAKSNQKPQHAAPVSSAASKPGSGVRPVSRKVLNALRRDRRRDPSLKTILKHLAYREGLFSKKTTSKATLQAREAILEAERVDFEAGKLYEKYKSAGVTMDACVFAVKTDWVAQFHTKWSDRASANKKGS